MKGKRNSCRFPGSTVNLRDAGGPPQGIPGNPDSWKW